MIATFWTTLPVARGLGAGPVAHFCQGYEGGLPHLAPVLPQIEAVYSWPLPALVTSPHLGDFLRLGPRRRPWIAVPGIFESEVKGVPTALEAVRRLRAGGIHARVLRFSPGRCGAAIFCSSPRGRRRDSGCRCWRRWPRGCPPSRRASPRPFISRKARSRWSRRAMPRPSPKRRVICCPDRRAWRRARALGVEAARRFRPETVAPRLFEAVRWAAAEGGPHETDW